MKVLIADGFKKCTKCKEMKPISTFSKDKSRKDGYSYTCKECASINGKNHYQKNIVEMKQKHNKYYQDNIDERREKCREYIRTHRVQKREYYKIYSMENKEKIAQKNHRLYIENKEQYTIKCREYRARNAEMIKEKRKMAYIKNYERELEQNKKYRKSLIGIRLMQRVRSNRRSLGFNPINEHFKGSDYHHLRYDSSGNIDNDIGVYIPTELHKSIWHNGTTGQGMEQINKLAIEWYLSTCNSDTEELQKLGFNNIEEFVDRYKPKDCN